MCPFNYPNFRDYVNDFRSNNRRRRKRARGGTMKFITLIGSTTMALATLSPIVYFNNPDLAVFFLVPQVLFSGWYARKLYDYVKEREGEQ